MIKEPSTAFLESDNLSIELRDTDSEAKIQEPSEVQLVNKRTFH
jgi:hypothetical protein